MQEQKRQQQTKRFRRNIEIRHEGTKRSGQTAKKTILDLEN